MMLHDCYKGPTVSVHSISRPAWDLLRSQPTGAQVLGLFQRAVDLLVGDQVLALVSPELLNGPFHLVLTTWPTIPLPMQVSLAWEPEGVQIGPWRLVWSRPPPLWEPRPGWEALTVWPTGLATLHALAQTAAQERASVVSELLRGMAVPRVAALGRAWVSGDREALISATAALAGWGPGLTPSGDDFLAGLWLACWVTDQEWAAALLPRLYAAAAPRTTRLSRAFLAAACEGLADERWHRLLAALAADDPAAIRQAAHTVLAFGATSGLDMITGFLWGVSLARGGDNETDSDFYRGAFPSAGLSAVV